MGIFGIVGNVKILVALAKEVNCARTYIGTLLVCCTYLEHRLPNLPISKDGKRYPTEAARA